MQTKRKKYYHNRKLNIAKGSYRKSLSQIYWVTRAFVLYDLPPVLYKEGKRKARIGVCAATVLYEYKVEQISVRDRAFVYDKI